MSMCGMMGASRALCGTNWSYAILGLRHDPICCCSLSIVRLKLRQKTIVFKYFGWAGLGREGMIVNVSEMAIFVNISPCLRKESQLAIFFGCFSLQMNAEIT